MFGVLLINMPREVKNDVGKCLKELFMSEINECFLVYGKTFLHHASGFNYHLKLFISNYILREIINHLNTHLCGCVFFKLEYI